MVPYKDYLIRGKAVRVNPNSPDGWRSHGDVFVNSSKGSIHIKHLEGVIFESKKAAEAHGLELCKQWVDENLEASDHVKHDGR
jgi:hypothetical protein